MEISLLKLGVKVLQLPFYNIAIRLAINNYHRPFYGIVDCADSIILNQGWAALYRGYFLDFGYKCIMKKFARIRFYGINIKTLLKYAMKNLFFICLNYCRAIYRIDPNMTIGNLGNSLLQTFRKKDRRVALVGAALIYFSSKVSSSFISLFFRRKKWIVKLVVTTVTSFPLICIGFKMIQKSLPISEAIEQIEIQNGYLSYFLSLLISNLVSFFQR